MNDNIAASPCALVAWGRKNSLNVQKVLWCLEDLGLPYRHEPAGGADGRLATAQFLALNPNGLVPVLEDGPLALWESNTIVRYLCNQYGPDAHKQSSPGQLAQQERWMDWYGTELGPHMTKLWGHHKRGKPLQSEELTTHATRAEALWGMFAGALSEGPFLGGRAPGPADYALGPALYRWVEIGNGSIDPRLQSLFQSLASRTAFNANVVQAPL
ncbi:glutathione S-transferase family protein [Cupriavidus oxalaticus]|uniref:glutathione S-transferase family protein n=1 Tax=Cupriavidus oxalaticus TaxID=96344 RepID=UPI004033CCA5